MPALLCPALFAALLCPALRAALLCPALRVALLCPALRVALLWPALRWLLALRPAAFPGVAGDAERFVGADRWGGRRESSAATMCAEAHASCSREMHCTGLGSAGGAERG